MPSRKKLQLLPEVKEPSPLPLETTRYYIDFIHQYNFDRCALAGMPTRKTSHNGNDT